MSSGITLIDLADTRAGVAPQVARIFLCISFELFLFRKEIIFTNIYIHMI